MSSFISMSDRTGMDSMTIYDYLLQLAGFWRITSDDIAKRLLYMAGQNRLISITGKGAAHSLAVQADTAMAGFLQSALSIYRPVRQQREHYHWRHPICSTHHRPKRDRRTLACIGG